MEGAGGCLGGASHHRSCRPYTGLPAAAVSQLDGFWFPQTLSLSSKFRVRMWWVSRLFTASENTRQALASAGTSATPTSSNGLSFSVCVCVCPCPTAPETSLCPQHRTGVPLGQSEELQPLSQHHPFLSHLGLASHPNGDWAQPCLTCDCAGRGGMAVCFFLPRNAGQLAGGCVSCQYSQLSPCVLWASWARLQNTKALSSSPQELKSWPCSPHTVMSLPEVLPEA